MRLPSVLQAGFTRSGLVKIDCKLLVPAYVGSQLGFSWIGNRGLATEVHPMLREAGVYVLDPFAACSEYLDFSKIGHFKTVEEEFRFWDKFNRTVGVVNYQTLMPRAKFMVALFDGGHALDDGLCSEVAYFAGKLSKPVVGIRSDVRMGENPAAVMNPAIRYFIDKGPYKGEFFHGPNCYDRAYESIRKRAERIRKGLNN